MAGGVGAGELPMALNNAWMNVPYRTLVPVYTEGRCVCMMRVLVLSRYGSDTV